MMRKNLNILHLINVRWFNASAEYAVTVSRELQKRGNRITIACKKDIPAVKSAIESGLQVDTSLTFQPLHYFSDLNKLKEICKKIKPDIIHAHHADTHALAMGVKFFLKSIFVVRTRVDIRAPKRNFFNRYIHQNTDLLIVPGKLLKHKVINSTGVPEERVRIIYGGLDTTKFKNDTILGRDFRSQHNIPFDVPVVGIVARLDPVKGHIFFIQIARELKKIFNKIQFVVTGKEAEYSINYLKVMAEKAGLKNHIIYTGFVDNVVKAINAFDICVLPSLGSEAHPRVLFEYMACGKPVVASRVGIVGEIIEDGMDGFVCKTGDVGSFVERIKFLLMSPEKRMQIGRNGRIKIEKNFNMDIFINNMEDAYYSVIEGNEDRA